ncbi:MAG TPA: potassium-transporting ATPase subunit KdpA [Thermodesulfovibrionales bacterium]|nr:potassium-transporting ATPase subunit KdpA [Thermodesulfovibrionales bacterium]
MQNTGMTSDIVQILTFLVVLTLLVKPFGGYMKKVYGGERTLLSPVLGPLEGVLYRISGIGLDDEMNWKRYAVSMLIFNFVGLVVMFAALMLQGYLPLNPQKFPGFSWHLAINTAVSFVTNTNWQNYSGESAASYFSQVMVLAVHNFLSAATGMAIVIAFIRGLARRTAETIGNFWIDMTRTVLYILLPISFVAALALVSQGVIQNFSQYKTVQLMEPTSYDKPKLDDRGNPVKDEKGQAVTEKVVVKEQILPMGPVASQEAIKELGTNGGGFFNANSAHPYENPTPLSNFLEILLILAIPAALTNTFGRMVGSTRQGWAIYAAMMLLLIVAVSALYWAEYSGNPLIQKLGVPGVNMEGKEVRFGLGGTALFTSATTGTSCGAVNTMHDSLTPLGGMIPLVLILSSEVVFGGVGSGLYTMLAFVIISVFSAGLMIGRIPEYLGKKIEVTEMWMSVITVLTAGVVILLFVALALITPSAVSSMANPGPHGLSEVLYAFASMSNNNGSAFAGLNGNTVFYNLLGSVAMLLGRFAPALAILAMAGSLVKKKHVPAGVGTLPTDQIPFVFWLVSVILIVGALTFFPVLSLGPIVEHMIMRGGV